MGKGVGAGQRGFFHSARLPTLFILDEPLGTCALASTVGHRRESREGETLRCSTAGSAGRGRSRGAIAAPAAAGPRGALERWCFGLLGWLGPSHLLAARWPRAPWEPEEDEGSGAQEEVHVEGRRLACHQQQSLSLTPPRPCSPNLLKAARLPRHTRWAVEGAKADVPHGGPASITEGTEAPSRLESSLPTLRRPARASCFPYQRPGQQDQPHARCQCSGRLLPPSHPAGDQEDLVTVREKSP